MSRSAVLLQTSDLSRVGPFLQAVLREAETATKTLGIGLQIVPVPTKDDFGTAFSTLQAGQAQGVVILRGAFMGAHVKTLVDLALKHRLPTISDMALLAAQGGLMSYGYNFDDAVREAAGIVDKILRGANVSGKEGREGKCHDGARSYAL